MMDEIEARRYFVGFVTRHGRSDCPIAYAPVLSMADYFATYPELHEVTFREWYVFVRENSDYSEPFPAKVPSETYYWQYLAKWGEY